MGRALSQDLRDRVVAAQFGMGVATAIRWRQMAWAHGRSDRSVRHRTVGQPALWVDLVEQRPFRRHLKVCTPDNDFTDLMGTTAS